MGKLNFSFKKTLIMEGGEIRTRDPKPLSFRRRHVVKATQTKPYSLKYSQRSGSTTMTVTANNLVGLRLLLPAAVSMAARALPRQTNRRRLTKRGTDGASILGSLRRGTLPSSLVCFQTINA